MSRRWWLAWVPICAASLVLAGSDTPGQAQVPEPPPADATAGAEIGNTAAQVLARLGEARIRRALARPVSVDFRNTPLRAAIAFLREACRIPILLDFEALGEVGVRPEEPVSLEVSEISLRSVLRLMLREIDLTYMLRHEALIVTTPEEAERHLTTHVYPVGDIAARRRRRGGTAYDLDTIAEGILFTVAPETWTDVGGLGSISVVDSRNTKALAITQTDEVHEGIAAILAALRSLARQAAEAKSIEPVFMDVDRQAGPASEAIAKAFERKISPRFIETPLDDVVRSLCQAAHFNVVLHRKALAEVGIPVDTPMTMHATDVCAESALRQLLNPLDLSYVVEHEVVVITTPEEAEFPYPVVFYPVSDLVTRDPGSAAVACGSNWLTGLITSTIRPETWEQVGGPGSACLAQFGNINALVVGQTGEVHTEIADLLSLLRKIARQAAEGNPVEPLMFGLSAAEERIAEQLKAPTVLEFTDCPLHDVIDALEDRHKIEIRIDDPALQVAGIESDRRVTKHLRGISLRAGLDSLLEPLGLTWEMADETILVTTPAEAIELLVTGFYPVGDLVVSRDDRGRLSHDYDRLIRMIRSAVRPESWDEIGGAGSVAPLTFGEAKLLVVAQTIGIHQQLAEFLQRVRRLAAPSGPDSSPRRHGVRGGDRKLGI
jgi:hypothetical protein